MIELSRITQRFASQRGVVNALDDVSLTVATGEIFGVIGRSGAGKSTLIRTINMLKAPTTGRVVVSGHELTGVSPQALRVARRNIGMIFQHFNLLASRTVFDNIALPLMLAGFDTAKIKARVMPLLERVGLLQQKQCYPAQISGGQKQRVGIARALASCPSVLLCDEATSALDPETMRSILALLKQIHRELKLTLVLITHQTEVIQSICDRVAVLDAGRIVELGPVTEVFLTPQHATTHALLGEKMACTLPAAVRKRIRAEADLRRNNGRYRVFRLVFTVDSIDQPVLSETIRHYGLDFNILHGCIDEIADQPVGALVVLTQDIPEKTDEALACLRKRGVRVEEWSHDE
jgi:D-methionine transport system ATP-binding protein